MILRLLVLLGALLWSPGLGFAAFPQVGSTALSSRCNNATDDSITMPAGIVAGDLLIVIHAIDNVAGTRTWSGGFTEILDLEAVSNVGAAYKIAAGGDTLTVTKSVSERFSAIALRITAASWHGTTPPEISATVTGSSVNPNPDAVTASWGSADNLFIAFHGHATAVVDTVVTAFPANYTGNQLQGNYCASAGEPNLATRELAAASDDPGTFTLDVSRAWRAGTIVVRPVAPPPVTGVFKYRKKITIDRTKVGNSGAPTTLANYPFLFNVTDPDLRTVANGGHVNDAAILVDAVSSGSAGASSSSLTIANHPTSGSNRLMLVGISISNDGAAGARLVNSVTYNGVSLGAAVCTGSVVDDARVWIYKLIAPPVTTANVVITLDGPVAAVGNITAGVMTFTGVDQTTPLGTCVTDTNDLAPHAATVTSATNEVVFDVFASEDAAMTMVSSPAGRTQRWNITGNNSNGGGGSTAPGASSVTMTWTANAGSTHWAVAGVPIKPANPGGTAGNDIIFRALDATTCADGQDVCTLDHEIEQYDPTTGKFVAWARIPSVNTISASSDTVIYIYYFADISSSTENPTGVWDSNFVSVWHMAEDPSISTDGDCGGGTKEVCDSTANNKDADSFNMVAGASVSEPTAKIAKALDFDGTDDRLEVPTPGLPTGDFTYSAWVKRDATSTSDYILFINANEISWYFNATDTPQQTQTNATTTVAGASNNGTAYHYLAWSRSGSTIQVYFDGAAEGTPGSDGTVLDFSTCQLLIAASATTCNTTPTNWFNGPLDELRVSNIPRSAHWIKTEYNNMNLTSCRFGALPFLATDFSVCEAEEEDPPSAVRLTKARALAYDGVQTRVVEIQWRTSYEVDHLGFHVYREQNGQRLRVTPALVAGSALKARAGTVLTAGQSYSWWDVLPADSGPLAYWLEEIDLHGQRIWHGPVEVESAKGHRLAAEPERVRSVLLTRMGRGKKSVTVVPWHGTRQAALAPPTPEQLAVQQQLAAGLAFKLGVQAEGWYRVSRSELVAAGLDPRVDPRRLHLYADGVEVPMNVIGEQDGRFDPADALEFYGLGLDTPWTDTRTYWLVVGREPGKRVGWVPSRQAGSRAPLSFPSTLEWRPRSIYFAALLNGEADNYFGPVVGNWPTDQEFTLTHLDPSAPGEAGLEVTLQGVTQGLHQVEVRLNGSPVGLVTFEGMAQRTTHLRFSQSRLQEGANVVTLEAQGGEMDYSLVASVRLTAWRLYQADADVLEAPVQGGDQVTITGFSSRQIRVLDVTQPDAVQAVPGHVKREKTGFAVTAVAPGSGSRILLAFTDGHRSLPTIGFNYPSQWHERGHGADLVILTPAAFAPSLAPLQAWRQQQGWAVALIDVQDVYDEFSFGAKSPWALRAFMQQARSQWARPPRFLLLAGDASLDPRNFMEMGDMDFVPTKLIDTHYLETASDDWFGDLDNNGVPEIAVGRLAVQTSEQADAVVRKLINYDRTGAGGRAAVLVADHDDRFDFEGASGQVKALLPVGVTVEEIYQGQLGDAGARAALLGSLNAGPWLLNYVGHGSVEVWNSGLLSSEDARTLTNGGRLPLVVTMTCLNGFFHDVWTESLAETLQKASQGGAVAVWASSALTDPPSQMPMNRALVQRLGQGLTLGEATAQAKAAASNADVRRTWILFGDPTTRLH